MSERKLSPMLDAYHEDGERCRNCGRLVMECVGFTWWSAPDDLWIDVWGNAGGILCPACFSRLCAEFGRPVHFEAVEGV